MTRTRSAIRRWVLMTVLSFSGGIIFLLPFLREVYYKPMAEAMGLSNTELGVMMSVFGFTSMIAYLPGGWLADRVSPRKLITASLLGTGAAGLYFSTYPNYAVSLLIHAFWGINASLLFWAAMIRVTRGWAPPEQQGRAFGILESMRGFSEVVTHSLLLLTFAWLGSSKQALSVVIVELSSVIITLGVLSWLVIEDDAGAERDEREKVGLRDILAVLRMPIVWLIAIVVLTAYSAYWASFYFTPYAGDIFLTSAAVAGAISVGRMWLKPLSAVIAGFVSDRFGIANSSAVLFLVLVVSFLGFAALPGTQQVFYLMLANIAVAGLAIFALRGIYFALLEEGGVPLAVTGTAAGVVSTVGYTPDIFMPFVGGVLLDAYPGVTGYRYLFLFTAGVCAVGLVAAVTIWLRYARRADEAAVVHAGPAG